MTVSILHGDALHMLRTLPAQSIQCCVTSPPYYGLRDYGVDGQIGLEETPDEYVSRLVEVFREVRRVLRNDGTLWLNLGDSYAGSWGAQSRGGPPSASSTLRGNGHVGGGPKINNMSALQIHAAPKLSTKNGSTTHLDGIKPKDLIGIPWRVAFALQADGWYLRQDIIWQKPNPMPESVEDRCTKAHEYVFLLTKRASYFYDAEAIREAADRGFAGVAAHAAGESETHRTKSGLLRLADQALGSRNMRSVWSITSQPFGEAHFATMPPQLAERCILAGTSARGQCSACGAPHARVVEKGNADLEHQRRSGGDANGEYRGHSTKGHAAAGVQDASAVKARILAGMVERITVGWQPTCKCAPPGTISPQCVLDPFGGAGTTALVADRLGRDAIIIELNADYVAMAQRRIAADRGPLTAWADSQL